MDEIGDMSLAAQAKVLRALQENKICRVGSDKDIDVDVRVIAATNKNLREEITKGNFREDLYHRIGVIVVRVPALRERTRRTFPMLARPFHPHEICVRLRHPAQTRSRATPWRRTAGDAVERQHPRTAQRHRAAHHPQRRAHHARRREDLLLKKRQPALTDRLSLFRTELPDYSRSRISAGLSTICSGSGFDKLFPIPKSPRDAHRAYARSRGGLHVHARIADVEHPLLRRARQRENLLHDGRIRLQRHPFDAGRRPRRKERREKTAGRASRFPPEICSTPRRYARRAAQAPRPAPESRRKAWCRRRYARYSISRNPRARPLRYRAYEAASGSARSTSRMMPLPTKWQYSS